jgi:CubicO group peptidase (beta-lactamase class C family)
MKVIAAVVALAVVGVLAEGARRALLVISMGAGLKAGHMCSAVFVAGRTPDAVLRDELADLHPKLDFVPDPLVDQESRSVSVSLPLGLMVRRAVWRERVGCTVLPPGGSVENLAPVASAAIPPLPGDPAEIPWPDGDLIPEAPMPPEVDEKSLGETVEAAFSRAGERPSRTLGVVVVYRGQIVAERYAPGFDVHTQYRSWSSAKSIVGALIGILIGEKRLELDAPAPIPEWQAPGDLRGQIRVSHLLHMSSGLESGGAWTPEAYWNGIDTAAAVSRTALEAVPGTRWKYSNYDTLLLVRTIREVMGDPAAYLAFPYRALLHRIGMRDTIPELDPYGNYILSSQVYTTPRDLARLGLLYLNDGWWQGERILPEGWVAYTTTPAPATLSLPDDHEAHAGYGAQFWLYGRDPRLPADTYSTSGARGQHATIVPSHRLVVARMGLDPILESSWDQPGFVAHVLEAIAPDPERPTRMREQP